MKTLAKKLTWLFVAALAFSVTPAVAQIVGSQHDLTTAGDSQNSGVTTDEVCVFCHTPHGADTSESALPLWNKTLPLGTGYTRYSTTGTPSFDATEENVGSISLACLSCHDGTQAMDSVINLPGSGGYNLTGTSIGIGDLMTNEGSDPIPMLGTDLSDDHPISIRYAAGENTPGSFTSQVDGAQLLTTLLVDPDFNGPWKDTVNGQAIWWLDTPDGGSAGIRDKQDLPLYSRTELPSLTPEPYVECGSCHDPHNQGSYVEDETVAFLRTDDNTASQICVACHNK